jgi:predicted  nucleic acid-binding Zn-ribbon protein
MSLSTLIESVLGKQRERSDAQLADFRGLVVQIANGKEPDADRVAQVLRDTGKSLDDLRQAVETLGRRRELRAKLDGLPKLARERRDVERQMAAADRELEEAEKRHYDITEPLKMRLAELKDSMWAAEQARNELCGDSADPDLRARLADVQGKLNAVRTQVADMRKAAGEFRSWASIDRDKAERVGYEDQAKAASERAEQRERRAAEIEKELPEVEKSIAPLEREEAAIRKQMLEP